NLQGLARSRTGLDGERFDEAEYKRSILENRLSLSSYLVLKTIVLYFAGDFRGALATADEAAPIMVYSRGFFYVVEHCFYGALARAAQLRSVAAGERDALIEVLRQDERILRNWAESAPANHAHRHALVAAELAAATGQRDAAIDLYDRAIALAK